MIYNISRNPQKMAGKRGKAGPAPKILDSDKQKKTVVEAIMAQEFSQAPVYF